MKVFLAFEASESLPPILFTQFQIALSRLFDAYALDAQISIDRTSELEAHRLFWEWRKSQREDDFPKAPADAEVV